MGTCFVWCATGHCSRSTVFFFFFFFFFFFVVVVFDLYINDIMVGIESEIRLSAHDCLLSSD